MLHQVALGLLVGVQLFELFDEGLRNRDKCLFGPWQEPINRALVEECWELSEPISELLADRRETKADMEVVSDPINEVIVKFTRRWVSTLELLHIIRPGIAQEGFLFVLSQQTRDLTSGKNHVDELQKLLFLDL